jgi:hypothetical protein
MRKAPGSSGGRRTRGRRLGQRQVSSHPEFAVSMERTIQIFRYLGCSTGFESVTIGNRHNGASGLSKFLEFLRTASKAAIETSNSVVILVIADLGSATGAASTQPNH